MKRALTVLVCLSQFSGISAFAAETEPVLPPLSLEDAFEHRLSQNLQEDDVLPPAMNPQDEAVQALAALGYSAAESLRAVRSLEDTEGMDTETILKMALKKLSRF